MKIFTLKLVSLIIVALMISGKAAAQESGCCDTACSKVSFNFGADVVSRYVWRGTELGGTPAVPQIQPYGSLDIPFAQSGVLTFGLWASYGLTGDYAENDFTVSYSLPTAFGEFSLSASDYYYPGAGIAFSNFKGNGEGAHTVEAAFGYTGPEALPFSFMISNNVHNDSSSQKSLYFEAGFPVQLGNISLGFFLGAAQGYSSWYGVSTEKLELINLGFTAQKEIKLSSEMSVPAALSFVYNPHIKKSFVIFKLSI